jgi:very-short-patch-repair endonuclease
MTRDHQHHRMRALGRLGRRQLGLVSNGQLAALGFQRGWRDAAVRDGRLVVVRRGVYMLPGGQPTWESAVMAAVMAAGAGAVASDLTAAQLWGLLEELPGRRAGHPIHVSSDAQRRISGVKAHRRRLTARERTKLGYIPVTTAARTIFDLGTHLDGDALGRVVDEALRRRIISIDDLRRSLDAHRGPGRRRLEPIRVVLAARIPGYDPGANDWEKSMDDLWDRLGLPPADRQFTIQVGPRRYRVDRAIPELKLAVEWVGSEYHGQVGRFHRDRLRISDLNLAGWEVVEVTPGWTQERIRSTILAKIAERGVILEDLRRTS